jgi:NAD(P)-dependent dehydrogenase (short-subunit alcohol dehydrogenase family)
MLWSEIALDGKRILITGASSGIGRSCAILCSELGAKIIACGRNEDRLA